MPTVNHARSGGLLTIRVIDIDVADLVADVQAGRRTMQEAKVLAYRRGQAVLGEAIDVLMLTDAQLDAAVADAQADADRKKALRPSGNL